jgi:hypothetical protein
MTLIATRLQEARVLYPNGFDKQENRGQKYGLLDLALQNAAMPQGIVSADLMAKAKVSWGNDLKIPALTPISSANGTGLSCTFSDTVPISELVAVTFVSISNGFQMRPILNKQNNITYAQTFANLYTNAMRSIARAVDILVDSTLTTNIATAAEYSSSYVGAGNKYGALVANKIQVALAQQPLFFNDLLDILAADDMEDETFDIVGSTNLRGIVKQIFSQGQGNSTNQAFQNDPADWDFKFSNRVIPTPVTSNASFFAMPKGSIALLSQNSPTNAEGYTAGDGKVWSTLFDPTVGVTLDTLFEDKCANVSAETGNGKDTADVLQGFQFAGHFALLTPYSNFAVSGISSTIRKADFLIA